MGSAGARMRLPQITSLRAKLFLAAIAVQVLMLVALTTQSLEFLNAKLEERSQLRLDEEKSLLVTSLADPLKRRDVRGDRSRIVAGAQQRRHCVPDAVRQCGKLIAKSGWNEDTALPAPGVNLHGDAGARRGRFDTEVDIEAQRRGAGQTSLRRVHRVHAESARRVDS